MTCKCNKMLYLNSGLSISIKNGEIDIDYEYGEFTEKIEFKYCPECGKQLDNRKEIPKTMNYLKNMFKAMKVRKCSEVTGVKGMDCKNCPLSGEDKRKFYCNRIWDILQEINNEYKLDK